MSTTLKRKLNIRNGLRESVRKIATKSEDLLSQYETNLRDEVISNGQILKEQLAELKNLDVEILEYLEEKDIEKDIFESNDLQHCILITRIESKTKQSRTETRQLPETNKQTTIKLPFLQLKKFGGNPTEWKAFWDAFASAIDNNTDLENVQKLNYLKSYLYGNAARAIDGFQATNENYEKAVKQLEKRFGDRQVMVSGHMNKFKEIKSVQNIMDINGLRELSDKLETNVRSLEAIGVQTETYEAILTPEILKKLPEELRILITRKLPDSWDLRSLLKIFREEVQVREKYRFALENKEENHDTATINTPPTRSYARQSHATTAALYSDTGGNPRSFRITCAFCANEHYSRNCEFVTDHNARREILRKKGKCYICLRSGHLARDCRFHIYLFNSFIFNSFKEGCPSTS